MADLAEPLYELMAERVRASHVVATDDTIMPMLSKGKTTNARMWVYVGDDDYPYNVFDFTLNRGRDGPKYFLKDYRQVLLADAYGGYNGVVAGNEITRAGCWAHMKTKVIDAEKAAPEIAREAVERVRALYAVEKQCKDASVEERLKLRQQQSAPVLALNCARSFLSGRSSCCPSTHGRGGELRAGPVDGTKRVLLGWCGQHRQQRLGARDEARRSQSQEQPLRWQSAWRQNGGDPGQPDQHLPPARYRPAVVSHAVADELIAGAQKRTAQLAPRPVETASGGTPAFVAPVLHIALTLLASCKKSSQVATSPCCQRDLPDVISANPSSDAWSLATAVPRSAHTCFFLRVIGLPHEMSGSASRNSPRIRLLTVAIFDAADIS
jgi:hypothetical protein